MSNQSIKEKSPEKQVAASYIANFYNEILLLTDAHSQYVNLLVELNSMSSSGEVGEVESNAVKQGVRQVRYYTERVYIQFLAISEKVDLQQSKDLETLYNKIMSKFVINKEDSSKFVILVNKVLVNSVIDNLLKTAREQVSELYD